MPGICISIEYFALPLILVGSSTRSMSLPISLKSAGFFNCSGLISGALEGTSANAAIWPYVSRRFDFS